VAEKSTRIAGAASGLYMAMRDAVETDDSSNARVVERVDFAGGKFSSPIGFPKRGNSRTLSYTSGGTYQVVAGDVLVGATSGATARVISLTLTGGTWAGGDAAGVLTLCDQTGTFQAENLDKQGGGANVQTVAGDSAASNLTTADTLDLTALPAGLTQNLITVGDKSMLCVAVDQYTSGGTVKVTPILYDNQSTPAIVGILPGRVFAQGEAFRRGSGSGLYPLPVQAWDVTGAYKIGLHVTAITGTSNYPQVFGWVI
jgi:hypothetical protein